MVVGAAVAVSAVPLVLRVVPVPGAPPSSAHLLQRVLASRGAPYAGYAETTGALALPVADQFADAATLLGGRTQLRVWWRSDLDWRVDTLDAAGERSLRVGRTGSWLWDFEDSRATREPADPDGRVRLPRADDGLAPALAARLLAGTTPDQVSTLPSRRVAGRPADGMRVRPQDPRSSIDRIDVWADRASGIPVAVDIYGRSGSRAALSTTFLDFTPERPAEATTAFVPPPSARIRSGTRFDLVDAVATFSPARPPRQLFGYTRQPAAPGAEGVGLYGRGVTQVAVAGLPGRRARSLEQQLQLATGSRAVAAGTLVSVGPVSLLLTHPDRDGVQWLLTGTMIPDGLATAGDELLARPARAVAGSP